MKQFTFMKNKSLAFTLYFLLFIIVMNAQTIKVGSKVDIPAVDGKTYKGTVKEIIHTAYKVEYDGFDGQYAWLTADQFRLAGSSQADKNNILPTGAYTKNQSWTVGDKAEFLKSNKWENGSIVEIKDNKYKMRFDGWSDYWDTWVTENELRQSSSNNAVKVNLNNANAYTQNQAWAVGARAEFFNTREWKSGSIVEIKDNKYKMRLDGWSDHWDTWVSPNDLRQPGSNNDIKVSLDNAAKGKLYLRHIRWLASGGSSLNWYFLADNGTIVVDPIHGVNPVNLSAERMDNMNNIGTYTLTKNLLKVQWVNGTTSEVGVEYKNGEIISIDAMSIVMRQYGVPAGFKLNGTYSGVLSAGGVSSGRTFLFSANGSFNIQNTGYVSTSIGNARSTNSKSGKYSISGNTLTLSYDDGTIEKSTIAIWDGRLVINGRSLPMVGN